jgi:arabinose operon protein AraL
MEVIMTKGYIFDLDGTVYLGDHPIEGAAEAISTLKNRGDRVVYLSNKPIATRLSYVDKLNKMGIEASLEDVLNSSYIMANYLKETLVEGQSVYVIGEEPLLQELEAQEILMTVNPLEASYVVLSWDRTFTYDKINAAFQAWYNGAKIIATNPDRTCPMEDGQIPDCGAMIGAIEGATNEPIHAVIGKPSAIMAETAMKKIGLSPSDCYMIGDRLETDIKMGNETGMHSVLVLTGITTEAMLKTSPFQPAFTINSIKEVPHL